ncbi:MAG: type ISP restriction/modification enzyme [Pyrinomonadaceae bacterium]
MTVADDKQVRRYLSRYNQVLVTNYRDFILVGRDQDGNPVNRERFSLAANEKEFWDQAAHPRTAGNQLGDRFVEYLKRVMLSAAPLTEPKDVAWFLASYARDAKMRIEGNDLPALGAVRSALEEALGLKFEGEKGEHFFRSTFVQTLFYGIFSAWVLWSKKHPPTDRRSRFTWKEAVWSLNVPMIRALFEQVATPTKLEPLGLMEVLDWTEGVLNRVDRAAFFSNFEEEHAVQYFYEPFLEAFDPDLRKELGVWYTPTEIVQYMVARVDMVLREELDIADGLADPRVYILDPCCGTGAFLVEVLKRIDRTLSEKGEDALRGSAVKRAAIDRVFGFEILPAPFVVSHLQLGILLQNLDAPFADGSSERAGVYLTNALTGWAPPSDEAKARLQQLAFTFAELKSEHDAADRVKQDAPILVILGNPPYNGFAGVAVEEERDLSDAYRTTVNAPAPQGQGLNDLYIRFFRMAERKIVEQTQKGIVCFISNYSWLEGLSFTGMRERFLDAFDSIWIDNLHGDRIISEYAPDGRTSETVFAVQGTSPGIKVGTSIALLLSRPLDQRSPTSQIYYRDMAQARAADRRASLLASVEDADFNSLYVQLDPDIRIGLPLKFRNLAGNYFTWPLLTNILPTSFPGLQTGRDDLLVDIDRDILRERMSRYFDPAITNEEFGRECPTALRDTARFDSQKVRTYLTKKGINPENIRPHLYRPFDIRWIYWEPETKLLDEKRSEYVRNVVAGNRWIAAVQQNRRTFDPPVVTGLIGSRHVVERGANWFPMWTAPDEKNQLFATNSFEQKDGYYLNLSSEAVTYLNAIGEIADSESLFYHIVAVLHAPTYSVENAGALGQDWPRVPVPDSIEKLRKSADLGREVAALIDTDMGVGEITQGAINEPTRSICTISRVGGGQLQLEERVATGKLSELRVTTGWGSAGRGGITMPGKGRVATRDYTREEREAMESGAQRLHLTIDQMFVLLGERTFDVYLNDVAYWRNIPERVWEYTIGGYQVMKKWLSYREYKLLGRPLTTDEAREVMNMARRIAAILLLESELDANYQSVKSATYYWDAI